MNDIKQEKLKELDTYIRNAYRDSNFHDSRHTIEKIKLHVPAQEIAAFLRARLKTIKENQKRFHDESIILSNKYEDRNEHNYESALSYVTHEFNPGDYIFVHLHGVRVVQVSRLTKKGYIVFKGNKLGTNHEVSFKNVICAHNQMDKAKAAILAEVKTHD